MSFSFSVGVLGRVRDSRPGLSVRGPVTDSAAATAAPLATSRCGHLDLGGEEAVGAGRRGAGRAQGGDDGGGGRGRA